jgi:hypothetical protein
MSKHEITRHQNQQLSTQEIIQPLVIKDWNQLESEKQIAQRHYETLERDAYGLPYFVLSNEFFDSFTRGLGKDQTHHTHGSPAFNLYREGKMLEADTIARMSNSQYAEMKDRLEAEIRKRDMGQVKRITLR